jgi:TRAP-type transport system periplasmic protein
MAFARAANRANADFTQRWGYEFPGIARQAATDAGITLSDADADFVAASQAFIEADRETAAQISAERFGMADAADRVAEFIALVDKWEAISAEVNHDPAAMADRVWDEVWSKVDLSTYGL